MDMLPDDPGIGQDGRLYRVSLRLRNKFTGYRESVTYIEVYVEGRASFVNIDLIARTEFSAFEQSRYLEVTSTGNIVRVA